MKARTRVVTVPRHSGHCPSVEVQCGRHLPSCDQVDRVEVILKHLSTYEEVALVSPSHPNLNAIGRIHDVEFLGFLETAWRNRSLLNDDDLPLIFADTFLHDKLRIGGAPDQARASSFGAFCFDTITSIGPGTWDASIGAVEAALTAADATLEGDALSVALCRPPGHHAARSLFGGGCYLNNAAISGQSLLDQGLTKIAILDLDFHHGNGTQSIFYDRPDVIYVSLHGDPSRAFPYFTGWPSETGTGRGIGANVNFVLPPHVEGDYYLTLLDDALEIVMQKNPEAVVVSLGFDAFAGDPAGDGELQTSDYRRIGERTGSLGLPTLAVLEGGYSVSELGRNIGAWITGHRDFSSGGNNSASARVS